MTWGVYNSQGKLVRRFRSCAAAHRWLIREGLEWSAYEIRYEKKSTWPWLGNLRFSCEKMQFESIPAAKM